MNLEKVKYRLDIVNPNGWSGITMYSGSKYTLGATGDGNGSPMTGLSEEVRIQLEKDLDMPEGHLVKGSKYKRNPFWLDFAIDITANGLDLDGEDPYDYLKICVLAAQPNVALGHDNVKSNTEFVLFAPASIAKKSNASGKTRRKAGALLEEMSIAKREALMFIYGVNPKDLSPDDIDVFLDGQILMNADLFLERANDPNWQKRGFIHACVSKNLLTHSNGNYRYGDIVLGNDVSETISSLFAEDKKDILADLVKQVQ